MMQKQKKLLTPLQTNATNNCWMLEKAKVAISQGFWHFPADFFATKLSFTCLAVISIYVSLINMINHSIEKGPVECLPFTL